MKITKTNPDIIKKSIPELIVVDDIVITGHDIMSDTDVEYNVSDYKVCGHMHDGQFHVVPSMKSRRYHEMSHQYTFDNVTGALNDRGIQHSVWKQRFDRSFGVMQTDFVLNRPYKINEKTFEKQYKISYADNVGAGEYIPMVRLTNSFFKASKLEFALIRVLCANGMIKIADKLSISFPHVDKYVMENFQHQTNTFLGSIFDSHFVENMIENMSAHPVLIPHFLQWVANTAGVRSVDKVNTQFKLDSMGAKKFNFWMAYNIVTWLASHHVRSQTRQSKMFATMDTLKDSSNYLKAA